MARCLVTGHKGYIGSRLFERLQELGHDVRGVDLQEQYPKNIMDFLNQDHTANFHPAYWNFKPEYIFHLAAIPRVAYSVEHPVETTKNNVEADKGISINITELPKESPLVENVGKATAESEKDKTWDGFNKFNEIPVNPTTAPPPKPQMSNEEMLREKFKVLRKLEALEKKGIELTKKYTMDSSLAEMKGEYEMIKNEKEKRSSVKFQGKMLMAAVSALEFLNSKFDPFDLKLDGWSEAINENLDEYDDVFGELHEKYSGKAKIAPELKLL